jgi:hypothetical protein
MHSTICEKSQKCLTKGLNLQPYSWQKKLSKEITYSYNFPFTRVRKKYSSVGDGRPTQHYEKNKDKTSGL